MSKKKEHINNKDVDEVYEVMRKTFTDQLEKHVGMTFEEMDIVLYRLNANVKQAKMELFFKWQIDGTKKKDIGRLAPYG